MSTLLHALQQRLRSKTYCAAIVGALLSAAEANSGVLSQLLPAPARPYAVLAWPALMLALREMTSSALADK